MLQKGRKERDSEVFKINKKLLKLNYLVVSSLTLHNQIIGLTFHLQTIIYGTKNRDLYFTKRIANAAGVNVHKTFKTMVSRSKKINNVIEFCKV